MVSIFIDASLFKKLIFLEYVTGRLDIEGHLGDLVQCRSCVKTME